MLECLCLFVCVCVCVWVCVCACVGVFMGVCVLLATSLCGMTKSWGDMFLFICSSDRAHHFTYYWLLCDIVACIFIWRSSSVAKSLASRSDMRARASIFVKKLKPFQGRFIMPKSFMYYLPPTPISCIPDTNHKLIPYHLEASYNMSPEWYLVWSGTQRKIYGWSSVCPIYSY